MNKKVLYVIGAILLLLIITNPGVKAFKDFLGRDDEGGLQRESNFFVCSTYLNRHTHLEYLGIASNFFKINGNNTTGIDINEVRKEALKQQADSAMLYSDTSDTNHNKISANAFAERIKSRFPAYKALDNKTLIRKLLIKFPEYRDIVDTTQ